MPYVSPICFPPFRLDPEDARLWHEARPLPLRPKAFAVLHYLLQHPGQLVTKEQLAKAVWSSTVVSETVLRVCLREIRRVLDDRATEPRFVETVPRRGYRFIGTIRTEDQAKPREHWPGAATLVGRAEELTRLHHLLEQARAGARQLVFVTGEPGIGKTALVEAFVAEIERQPHLWTAHGQCIEHYGGGEPYLPFLEALEQLCRRPGHARLLPLLRCYAPLWLAQLPAFLTAEDRLALQREGAGATQARMLREMATLLEVLTGQGTAEEAPLLVLWLEDLQWSDAATLNLLAALARRREPARLLIIGTYRPVDVIVHGHSLREIRQELHQHRQCQDLALAGLTAGAVAEYLTKRFVVSPFPAAVVKVVHQRTEGNPLFLMTLVDEWVAHDVIRQRDGQWTLQAEVSDLAATVPDSIRQMIEQQIDRLRPQEQHVLEAASVAGAEFSAAAVAGIDTEVGQVEEWCAGLVRRHLFLRSTGISEWPDGTVAQRYSFLHALHQQVVYERVPAGRRIGLHRQIGEREERAYRDQADEIATELATHFERGRDYWRAVQYCERAGQLALRRAAHHEAIAHFRQGLNLLQALPDTPDRAQHELRLLVALGAPLQATKGYSAPEVAHAYARAQELSQQVAATPRLFPALWGLWVFHVARAELETAHQLGAQLLRLARSTHDPVYLLEAHRALGETLLWRGEVALAHTHLEQGLALHDPQRLPAYAALYDLNDPRVLCGSRSAMALCVLGYPDQAMTKIYEVLALAHELSAAFSLAMVRNFAALLHHLRREVQATHEHAAAARTLAAEHGFVQWEAWGTILGGWALAAQACPASQQGADEEGMRQMCQGLAAWQASGAELGRPYHLALLAEAYGDRGQTAKGLNLLAEALAAVNKTREGIAEAELYRLKGELTLRAQGRSGGAGDRRGEAEAEGCFQQAIKVARGQHTKLWELRAAVSLSRLWQQQGKREEARQLLAESYGWFTEGFDTPDLQEAKALLVELA